MNTATDGQNRDGDSISFQEKIRTAATDLPYSSSDSTFIDPVKERRVLGKFDVKSPR